MRRLALCRLQLVVSLLQLVVSLLHLGAAHVLKFGGVPDDKGSAHNNTATLNAALALLQPGDTLAIGKQTYWLAGGVKATGLVHATIQLDGTLRFLPGRKGWPTNPCVQHGRNKTCVQNAITLENAAGLTLTSSGSGTVDGNGEPWWGYAQYLLHREAHPRKV